MAAGTTAGPSVKAAGPSVTAADPSVTAASVMAAEGPSVTAAEGPSIAAAEGSAAKAAAGPSCSSLLASKRSVMAEWSEPKLASAAPVVESSTQPLSHSCCDTRAMSSPMNLPTRRLSCGQAGGRRRGWRSGNQSSGTGFRSGGALIVQSPVVRSHKCDQYFAGVITPSQ